MKFAVVLGSTRPGRAGSQVAAWVMEQAELREDAEFDLLDLSDFDLDLLNEPTVPGAAKRQYENPKTRRWSEAIDSYDGYVWVSPEYNHSVPAAMKNAFDVLYPEWSHKAAALVTYGAMSGSRAAEHWRLIMANAKLIATRAQLTLSTFDDFEDGQFKPRERRPVELDGALTELLQLSGSLQQLRS